jgi:hypothetical protein
MKKLALCLVFICILSFCFVIGPKVSAQTGDLKVLNYSWYIHANGNLIVVGEVQNTGTNKSDFVMLTGNVFTIGGQAQATAYANVYPLALYPGQKGPFYIIVGAADSFSGDLSWLSLGIDHVDFNVGSVNTTSGFENLNLNIPVNASIIDPSTGVYSVEGLVWNFGDKPIGRNLVLATFYNASGDVIRIGVTREYLSPSYLLPNNTTEFVIFPLDITAEVSTQITSYKLLIQSENVHSNNPASPSESPSTSATPSASASPSPSSSPSNSAVVEPKQAFPMEYVYAVIAILAIVVIVLVAVVLRRGRKPEAKADIAS